MQSSTKVREMFRANNSETVGHKNLSISLLQHFIFLASSTEQFPIYFLGLCLLRDSEDEELEACSKLGQKIVCEGRENCRLFFVCLLFFATSLLLIT